LLGTLGPIAMGGDVSLQVSNVIFGRAKLLRELLSPIQRVSAVLIGRVGRFPNHL
jgi:hypothetical protein